MELSVKLLAALPARAEGLGSVTSASSPFRPKFSIQLQLLGPDGITHVQRTKEFSLKDAHGSRAGGAAGGSRPQLLGHQTLTFSLPRGSCSSSRASSPCDSSGGRSRLGSPAGSFTAGGGSCEQQWAVERAATELRFGVLGKLSDMTTDVLMAQGSITLSQVTPDGQPHPAAIQMRRWCGAAAGQAAGELAVELRLRQRRRGGSQCRGLLRRPSGGSSVAGLLSRSASGSGSLSHSASIPSGHGGGRSRLGRLLFTLQPTCARIQVAPV